MSLRDDDDREWRRIQREEARASLRGTALADDGYGRSRAGAPMAPPQAPRPAPQPAPTVKAPKPGPQNAAPKAAPAFRIVDELPAHRGRVGRSIPARRQELIDFAKANPGRWIEYPPAGDDNYKSISSFIGNIRKGTSGFDPEGAFEASARNKVAYVRYVGTDGGDQS